MKTQDLLQLTQGTELAINHSGRVDPELAGGVPPYVGRYLLHKVRVNGHYSEVLVYKQEDPKNIHVFRPAQVYATYADYKAQRAEADTRMRAEAEVARRERAAHQARFEALKAQAAQRGAEVSELGYEGSGRVVMSIEALEALLGE